MERRWWKNMQAKVEGHMDNQFFILFWQYKLISWYLWFMKNHKTVIKSMYIDQ